MGVYYDSKGRCTTCRLPGSGFVEDGVCECMDDCAHEAREAYVKRLAEDIS